MNKGKAVAVKEEVSSTAAMGTAPTAHHQAPPPLNISGREDKGKVQKHPGSSALEVGSSSSAAAPSSDPEPAVMAWAPVILPPPGSLPLGDSGIVLVKRLLDHCAAALEAGNVAAANTNLLSLSCFVAADGDPTQRVAFAFAEALARRALQALLPGLSWGLGFQQELAHAHLPPPPAYAVAARRCFDALCPFLRVAASAANQTIVAATASDKFVHVVDLGGAAAGPDQWLDLLCLFAARPYGAPFLPLTVVGKPDDDELLSHAAGMLTQEATRLHLPWFVFNPVRPHVIADGFAAQDIAALGVDAGEALVITSRLQLHRLIADEIDAGPRWITGADALLRVLRGLSPKLLLLTEQEADHNGGSLRGRVRNALGYYEALFGDLESGAGASRASVERGAVERVHLREEIMDIVAREGASRRERHESMARWAERMCVAGFVPAPVMMSPAADVGLVAQQVAADGTLRYWVKKKQAYITVYSRVTPMFSVTAWCPAGNARR